MSGAVADLCSDDDKEMAANKENNNGVDDASRSEEPGVVELLRALMAKMDVQAQAERMDAQAWEFREAVQRGLGIVRNEARQFAEELCGGITAELLHEVRDVHAKAQEAKKEVVVLDEWGRVMREKVAALEEAGRAVERGWEAAGPDSGLNGARRVDLHRHRRCLGALSLPQHYFSLFHSHLLPLIFLRRPVEKRTGQNTTVRWPGRHT